METTKIKARSKVQDRVGVSTEVSKSAVTALGGVSALIGLWAVACFLGALFTAGPIGLIKGWISAVTGM